MKLILSLCLYSLLIITLPLLAQEGVDLIGECTVPGAPGGFRVVDNYAYITTLFGRELAIVDVSDPTEPTLISLLDFDRSARDVALHDHFAYIACGEENTVVVDVGDPFHPFVVTEELEYEIGVVSNSALIHDDMLLVAGIGFNYNICGFSIFSLNEPVAPPLMGDANMRVGNRFFSIPGMVAQGSILYLAFWNGGFWTYDISDPTEPFFLGSINLTDGVLDVDVHDNFAFLAINDDGVALLDISSPATPELLYTLDLWEDEANSVEVVWDMGIVAARSDGVRVIDLDAPNGIVEVGYYNDWMLEAWDIEVKGDYIYATDFNDRLIVLDWSEARGGVAEVDSIVIPLRANRRELISTPIVPSDLDASVVFGLLESLVIAYNEEGNIYIPDFINSIGNIDLSDGYSLFCEEADTLVIYGETLSPNTVYHLEADRLNWIGYPFNDPDREYFIEEAFEVVRNDIGIILTDEGEIWIPDIINSIGRMQGGVGYYVHSYTTLDFQYSTDPGLTAMNPKDYLPWKEDRGLVHSTGVPYAVVVHFDEVLRKLQPFILRVYDDDVLVGEKYLEEGREEEFVVVWEGVKELEIAGFKLGNQMIVKVFDEIDNEIAITLSADSPVFGELPYSEVSINSASTSQLSLPRATQIGKAYPNPFNSKIIVPIEISNQTDIQIRVVDLLGREVYEDNRRMSTGKQEIEIDVERRNGSAAAGIYILSVQAGNSTRSQKILYLK
ncbi:T9SS type A sorting domain-containing protein [bacterium]|nr:T9SS type A sorting domain-containing protein [bacterium]